MLLKYQLILLALASMASAAPPVERLFAADPLGDDDIDNALLTYTVSKKDRGFVPLDSVRPKIEREDLARDEATTVYRPKSVPAENPDDRHAKVSSIAHNVREVRIVGPGKEVEVKDDVATRMAIALDNLQKEATEMWGTVNDRLDKTWTELKQTIERTLSSQRRQGARQLREVAPGEMVIVSSKDGYSLPTENKSSIEDRVRSLLKDIGIDETKQKQATDALSSAGASVSETVTKDIPDAFNKAGDAVKQAVNNAEIPDALKKAGEAINQAVSKDIPDAVKNIFG